MYLSFRESDMTTDSSNHYLIVTKCNFSVHLLKHGIYKRRSAAVSIQEAINRTPTRKLTLFQQQMTADFKKGKRETRGLRAHSHLVH